MIHEHNLCPFLFMFFLARTGLDVLKVKHRIAIRKLKLGRKVSEGDGGSYRILEKASLFSCSVHSSSAPDA
jgi:hypothetical protein